MTINILQVNAYDIEGGAARAAYRIHRCLVDHGDVLGLKSRMRVIFQQTEDNSVIGGSPRQNRLWADSGEAFTQPIQPGIHTLGQTPALAEN